MKKMKIFVWFLIFIIVSCGTHNKQEQLEKLIEQRNQLNEKIERLKDEIAKEDEKLQDGRIAYVNIQQVNPREFKHFIKIQGSIESDRNILIPPKISGIVKKIHVKKGDRVKKGQLLVELDGSILERSIDELKTNLELAKTIYERRARLWEKNIGSEIEYLQAKNNKESLEKRLATLEEQYRQTKLYSPINGTVDEILIKEGESASAGFGAIRIVQLSALKVKASLSEKYISNVKKNDSVKVFIPTIDKELNLTINAVSQVIDAKNRTFNIEIDIPESIKGVKPNMMAEITINDYTNKQALTVPQKVIRRISGKEFLFVVENEDGTMVARKRMVKTGKAYGGQVEILSGLEPGESVITFGYQDLADGQRIAIGEKIYKTEEK